MRLAQLSRVIHQLWKLGVDETKAANSLQRIRRCIVQLRTDEVSVQFPRQPDASGIAIVQPLVKNTRWNEYLYVKGKTQFHCVFNPRIVFKRVQRKFVSLNIWIPDPSSFHS